jgi:hypothetical protein
MGRAPGRGNGATAGRRGCRRQPDRQWLNARGRESMDQRNE